MTISCCEGLLLFIKGGVGGCETVGALTSISALISIEGGDGLLLIDELLSCCVCLRSGIVSSCS